MNYTYQQFIRDFKLLIEKEKESNKTIHGIIRNINQNVLEVFINEKIKFNKNMSIEINRIKAKVLEINNRNVFFQVEDSSLFKVNQDVSLHNIQKDIIIHKLQETYENIINKDLTEENRNNLCVLFGNITPTYTNDNFVVKNLNKNQKIAVEQSLQANKFHLIQGPPGTGKTHTIIEIIKQLHKNNQRILITTHTHIALDNILERLDINKDEVLRMGVKDKISPKVSGYSMENHIKRHDLYSEIIKKEKHIERLLNNSESYSEKIITNNHQENFISKIFRLLFQIKNNEITDDNFNSNYDNQYNTNTIHELKLEIENIKKNIRSDILKNIKIYASTVISSSSFITQDLNFDYVIMDEASQVPVYLSLIPLLKTDKFILIGDNKQLQPIQNNNSSYILNKSIFNLLIEKYPQNYTFLNIQYRMNEQISNIASKLYYDNNLLTGENVKKHKIELKHNNCFLLDEEAITVIDTSNINFNESNVSKGCCNKYESYLIINIIDFLKRNSIPLEEIGIITPYNKQKSFIKKLLERQKLRVECDTIYRFQGREKDVIILSFCKSSDKALTEFQSNFLADENQLNVSITRSRKKLIIIGNLDLLKTSTNINNLIREISLENIIFLEDIF